MELIMKHFGWKQVATQFIEWWNQGRMVRQRQDYDMVCVSGSQVGTLPLLAMQWSKGPLWFKILCCTSYIKQIRCSPFEDMPHAQSSTNKVLKWSAVKSFLYGLSVAAVPSLSVWWGPSGCSPNYRDHTYRGFISCHSNMIGPVHWPGQGSVPIYPTRWYLLSTHKCDETSTMYCTCNSSFHINSLNSGWLQYCRYQDHFIALVGSRR